ncbi:(R)-specific enoyl-CoA hydratase RipB/Ich [soil metagenome]
MAFVLRCMARHTAMVNKHQRNTVAHEFQLRATLARKGHHFEDFEPGRAFEHHWGRTIRHSESALFVSLTLDFNPMNFNREYAAAHGLPDTPVSAMHVFATVFGLSVEDLSELGGAFLGVDNLVHETRVYPDDTLRARSTVVTRRDSGSNKALGIVTWHTEGFNQRDELVVSFDRTNLVTRRNPL